MKNTTKKKFPKLSDFSEVLLKWRSDPDPEPDPVFSEARIRIRIWSIKYQILITAFFITLDIRT